MSQVAVATVAVVPTFKGFRRAVSDESDGAAQTASTGFKRFFAKTGTDSGKQVGSGFKAAFEQSSEGTFDRAAKALQADVTKMSRTLSAARLKEQDAIGKVRVAQAQLNEANRKYASDSSQVVRAQERLATASRQLGSAHESTERATDGLKRAQGELARVADRAGDELSAAGSRGVTGFRSSVVGGVKSFAGPLVAAFAALGIGSIVANAFDSAKDFISGSVGIASDLNESVNAVQVAYGDAADAVLKLGENSAETFGLSRREMNAYATQFSSFVGTLAGETGDVAGTLETLVGRGTDFASVFNMDVSEALRIFQSGLAGETEPLRKFGIDLSAATVEAYAYANGIASTGTQLTEAQKVQARYGALLEQTAKVQGDFVNTSGELENLNRKNAATWDDIQAKIGEGFLPVAQQLASMIADDVLPVISELSEEYGPKLAEAFADILPSLIEIAQDVLPLLPAGLEAVAAGLPMVIALIQQLLPLLSLWTDATLTLNTTVGGFFALLTGDTSLAKLSQDLMNLGGPVAAVLQWGADLVAGFTEWFEAIPTAVEEGINSAIEWLEGLPGRALEAVGSVGDTLVQSGKDLMGGFISGIQSSPVGDAVSGVLDWVGGFFPNSPAKRGPLSGSGWSNLRKSGEAYWDQFVGGMGGAEPEFPGFPGASGGAADVAAGPVVGAGSSPVSQVNYFDKTDPREGAELANQMLAAALRGA